MKSKLNRWLVGSVIIALLVTSGVSVLADENYGFSSLIAGESYEGDENHHIGDLGEGIVLPSPCDDLGEDEDCCSSIGEEPGSEGPNYDDIDINEVELEEEVCPYEALKFLYVDEQVIHTPMEQNIALGFKMEEMVITSATLHTRSLLTDEEFSREASNIVENLVLFSIYYGEESREDEILIESIKYTIEGREEALWVVFYQQEIEASYIITQDPLPGCEEAGITIYGFGEDGELIYQSTTVEEMVETIEEILDTVDDSVEISEPILEEEWEELLNESLEGLDSSAGFTPTSVTAPVSGVAAMVGIAPTSTNRIIAVSAGHCSTHTGASANGLHEYQLTWHVANVVRNELNRYAGITAILDRPTIHCRYFPGVWTTEASNHCLTQRVRDARAAGATVFVDIHFNSGPSTAHGAEVWIPHSGIHDGRYQEGVRLSNAILGNLARLGITNRGYRTRVNDHGRDWLATNRVARELGMTGILVEGGFLTNVAEANRLRDPNFRQNLGIQIARGIASAYGASIPAQPEQLTSTTTATNVNSQDRFYDLRVNFNTDRWVSRVQFEVWAEANGQSRSRWYNGTRQANGSWTNRVDIRNHGRAGRYQVRTWVTLTNGNRFVSSSTTFNVTAATGGRVEIFNSNLRGGTFDARLRGFSTPSGVSEVRVAVWTRANRSDIRWTTATRRSCGFLGVRIQTNHHNFHVGTYHVRFRITTRNGQVVYRDTTHFVSQRPVVTVSATNRSRETLFDLSVANASVMGEFRTVRFGVWSEHNGMNDVVWYNATLSNGVWRGIADVRRHRYAGTFRVNAWGIRPNNERVLLGRATFYVSRPTGGRVEVFNSSPNGGTFDARLRGFSTPSGVSGVRVAVWTRADRSDLRWTTATRRSCGFLGVRINASHHNFHSGTYHVRFRITTRNGQIIVRDTTHFFNPRPSAGLIRIMGTSQTSVAQMVRNFNNTGHTFPTAALGMNLNSFAQLVMNEANREGVRAEVLWTQIMRETGWLQFRGDVRIHQFNFGGLGATGGGNPGHSFPSVQIGLRAQVHHLVAYATTAPVRHPSNRAHPVMRTAPPWGPTGETRVNGTESPRFHFVARGISPYVNWLGQGENPNHPGFWAADRNYGAALAAAIRVLLNS